jgi:hypothetical protein
VSQARWTDPRFIAAAHRWLREVASEQGIALTGPIEQVHLRPWSTVFRAPASGGPLFLKAEGITQSHEPRLIELVARERPDLVPGVVARHPTEPWILLRDGGTRLRVARPGIAQLGVWRAILPRYAELQRGLLGREAELLATGLPDRRPERIPELLEHVLDDVRWAPDEARSRVRALVPKIRAACAELAADGIGVTLDHDDLHDHNLVLDGDRASIIDWGDASLTHPFLTLAVTLRFAAEAAGLPIGAPEIEALRDAYLGPWGGHDLRRAADLGAALGVVTGGLTWYEIITRLDGAHADEPGEMTAALDRIAEAIGPL